jgi:hypothetical protein
LVQRLPELPTTVFVLEERLELVGEATRDTQVRRIIG